MYLRLLGGRIWLLTPFGEWVTMGARQSSSISVTDTEATVKARTTTCGVRRGP
jgi:hypothetical protein